jgi:hypothetical protein
MLLDPELQTLPSFAHTQKKNDEGWAAMRKAVSIRSTELLTLLSLKCSHVIHIQSCYPHSVKLYFRNALLTRLGLFVFETETLRPFSFGNKSGNLEAVKKITQTYF